MHNTTLILFKSNYMLTIQLSVTLLLSMIQPCPSPTTKEMGWLHVCSLQPVTIQRMWSSDWAQGTDHLLSGPQQVGTKSPPDHITEEAH